MKKLTTLFALSALALTACTESGTGQSSTATVMPQQQGESENPFDVTETDTDRPSEDIPITDPPVIVAEDDQPPIIDPPVIDPPVIDPPIVEPPEILSDPPSGQSGELLNGNDLDSANSIWICSDTGADSADEVVVLAFFGDGSGIIGDGETFEVISWITNGPYIELYFNGQFLGQLDNVSVSVSADTFNASYVQPDGASGVLDCQLTELPDVDEGADVGGTTGGSTGDTGAGSESTVSGMLINDFSDNNLNTAWSCGLADDSSMAMFFLADGIGGLSSDQYPDGISMTWSSSSQGVSMSLDDGNQIIFSTPQFSDSDFFQAENVNIQGANVAGMDCQLVQI